MDSKTKRTAKRAYATMVTNFDSTEQKHTWNKLLNECQQHENELAAEQQRPPLSLPQICDLWVKNHSTHSCENMLHAHTSFATYFAGVIRTAYLYCPQIMLTDAEICDGLFFLALGPKTVNSLLGKSYKDGPSIIISGRAESFEECLFRFTLTTVGAVRKDAANKHINLDATAKQCPATDEQFTIRPLEYCTLDRSVSHDMALSQPPQFYEHLTEQVNAWKSSDQHPLPNIIEEAFTAILHCSEHHFAYLSQRWQEWLDAIAQGMVIYENQNASDVRNRIQANQIIFKGKNFKEIFDKYSADNANILSSAFKTSTADDSTQEFLAVLAKIKNQEKRSDAFASIDQSNLPEGAPTQQKGPIAPTKSLLKDWYQFVYQRTLATHLGACLTAVSASENSYEQIAGQHMASLIEDQPMETPNQTHPHKSSRLLNKAPAGLKRRFAPSPSQSLMLSGSITDILGGMPYHVFACFCYEARTTIAQWRSCSPDTSAREKRLCTKNIAYLVQQASEEISLLDDGKTMLFKNALAGALALISALCDQIWFNGNSVPLWLMVVVAWFISMVPDIWDMVLWLKGTHSTFKTIVFMEE